MPRATETELNADLDTGGVENTSTKLQFMPDLAEVTPMEKSAALTMMLTAFVWVAEALRQKDMRHRTPVLTLAACGLLAMCLLAQLRYPLLLGLFERNRMRLLGGEWWRAFTALFFQDGWIVGGITNIITLFFIGNLVEQVRSRRAWLLIGAAGALAGEGVALRWQPIGAGNSIATCSLAGSLVIAGPFRRMSLTSKVLRIFAVVLAVLLVAIHDFHGIAYLTGILTGSALKPSHRPAQA